MGQQLSAIPNPDGPLMRLRMVLSCDLSAHGMFPAAEIFDGDDYIEMRKLATTAGWQRISGGMWRGPCCKGYGNETGE